MRLNILLTLLLLGQIGRAQDEALLDRFLDAIRQNPAELTAFFQQMPKGGDLHHHYSGAIYAENYLQAAIDSNLWIHPLTLEVQKQAGTPKTRWKRLSALTLDENWPGYREALLRHWSVKDYPFQAGLPSDQHFFATFDRFDAAKGDFGPQNLPSYAEGLLELRHRALSENVQYIETMFTGVKCLLPPEAASYNSALQAMQTTRNESALHDTLDALYRLLDSPYAQQCVQDYAGLLRGLHDSLRLDDEAFTIRYQTFTVRTVDPVRVFARLALCFQAAQASPLIVGVNIVAPENDPVSMRDYWLHMQMYRYLHRRFPGVKYAMHAGELALGMVPPEELGWHIRDAVLTAGARRIGHGVDLPYESNCYALLDSMRRREVAVEINLTSNEFILGVKDGRHPVTLYHRAGVPIVISTDDAGVLRSNLTEQYVLLAGRYPEFSYSDIKKLVFNSVTYSFIEEEALRTAVLARLETQFDVFEMKVKTELERRKF